MISLHAPASNHIRNLYSYRLSAYLCAMETFFSHYLLFLADTVTIVVALLIVAGGITAIAMSRRKNPTSGQVQVSDLRKQLEQSSENVQQYRLDKKALKVHQKALKKDRKDKAKDPVTESCTYLLDFKGDIRASAVSALREEISAIIQASKPGDTVLLRLESGGGMVNTYGLAAAQILRLRAAKIHVTALVDAVAASGGYMMAVTADRIVASPFALIGSIGVVAQIPNFHRWLQDRNIDWEQFTAGKFKRTVTLFGENTDSGRAKLREELEETHALFREFVQQYRPHLELEQVATGEAWLGSKALQLGLVDQLATSDEIILEAAQKGKVLTLHYQRQKTFPQRLGLAAQQSWDKLWQTPH
ncbi:MULTISPECIES: protease SohB [Acidithiobacillus]|jgi:serine protease SohB|nr:MULTISPECIES: protease SohB [Acidithiobacillus]MDA8151706.1 protease SohB [Acidithiobacillus sp.]MDA8182687.1 protease SohB [Acidithiobacillus sp.]MEB8490988.1 protease SohB [Acidithiobacillus ferriphilus]MEB8493863.1 protease SohB [Acidithiobacillus ferriphilus]MEB8514272.1 protease SohB [Acidithiobacillus ferriphilus]